MAVDRQSTNDMPAQSEEFFERRPNSASRVIPVFRCPCQCSAYFAAVQPTHWRCGRVISPSLGIRHEWRRKSSDFSRLAPCDYDSLYAIGTIDCLSLLLPQTHYFVASQAFCLVVVLSGGR